MMPKLPTDLSGREVRRALERAGFGFQRQRGSHMVPRRAAPYTRVIVLDHKSVRVGALRQILHDTTLSVDEFLKLLGRD